jgi:hypothetical protein
VSGRWTTAQYDLLERAIRDGRRLAIMRGGSEFVVVPRRLALSAGREVMVARHPTTGEELRFTLEEIERFEEVR